MAKPPSDRHAIDEAAIAALVLVYSRALNSIGRVIVGMAAAGVTRASVQTARAQIQQQLAEAGQQAGQWVDDNVSATYQRGQQAAATQLQGFDNPVAAAVAAAILTGTPELNALHTDSMQTIKEELAARLSDALTSMGRSANYLITRSLNQSLRAQIAGMTDTAEMKRTILKSLDDNGIYGLVDKAGRRWNPDVYADNVARTYLMQARNTAVTNALSSQGYDLVVVSAHGAEDACGPWEDAVLSINGATPGFYTVGDATGAGLFHNNCKHELNAYYSSDTQAVNPDS
jgi:hypothetical protein